MTPLVSICLPNLNMRQFLEQRLESIRNQTVADWELIICDSYSTDGSWEFFNKFRGDPRIKAYQVPRKGVYAGWNECLRRARGRYVWIATSDDTAEPFFLECLLQVLEAHEHVAIAACDYDLIDKNGNQIPYRPSDLHKRRFFGEWLSSDSIRHGQTEFLLQTCFGTTWTTMTAIVFRRSLLDQIGLFRTDRSAWADTEWSLRACLRTDIAYIGRRLVSWRLHPRQASADSSTNAWAPHVFASVKAVLDDPTSPFPPKWKAVPEWKTHILAKSMWDYFDSFQLYRHVLRDEPISFFRGILRSLTYEPRLIVRQFLHGFRWSHEFSPDPVEAAHRLLQIFGAPWPPLRIKSRLHED